MNMNTDIQEGDKVDFFKFYPTAKNISFEISLCWAKLANAWVYKVEDPTLEN